MVEVVKERIGLRKDAFGFSLFEVFGPLERNMLPTEKVADAMFKWEKYARSTHSPKILKLTFKVSGLSALFLSRNLLFALFIQKRLFIKPYMNLKDPVEVNLLLHQAIDDVISDRYPLSSSEAIYLAALRAQVVLGGFNEDTDLMDYM